MLGETTCRFQRYLALCAENIAHGFGGFFLGRGGDMGVSAKGEGGGEVTQHAGQRLDIHAVLQGDGGESVAEVMEPYLRDACPFQYPLEHIVHAVWRDGTAVGRREDVLVIRFCLLLFQNFYRLL